MYCDLNKVLQFKKKPFEILSINTNTYFYNLFKKFEKKTKKIMQRKISTTNIHYYTNKIVSILSQTRNAKLKYYRFD